MAGEFWTEKQMEAWLESEARPVTMPDGSKRLVRDNKLFWETYDFLVNENIWTEKRLVELALRAVDDTGHSFEEMFVSVVCTAMQAVDKFFDERRGKA